MGGVNGMLNHEQYDSENRASSRWSSPQSQRAVGLETGGVGGVSVMISAWMGRGQAKSGHEKGGIHVLAMINKRGRKLLSNFWDEGVSPSHLFRVFLRVRSYF